MYQLITLKRSSTRLIRVIRQAQIIEQALKVTDIYQFNIYTRNITHPLSTYSYSKKTKPEHYKKPNRASTHTLRNFYYLKKDKTEQLNTNLLY
ncbi:hypothetical protein EMIT0P253_60055 [Pseudomonas sp. IT-P253]